MPNRGKQTCEAQKRQTNMLSNKRECPRRTNVGLDQVSIVPLDWSTGDTQTHARTCKQACKDAKKQRKPNGWHKASISISHGVGRRVYL